MITDLIMGVSHFCKLLQGSRRFFRWKKRKGLQLTDPILKIAKRVIHKVIRQKVDIVEKQFSFKPG